MQNHKLFPVIYPIISLYEERGMVWLTLTFTLANPPKQSIESVISILFIVGVCEGEK